MPLGPQNLPVLTLLTATGARPHAWAICERLMAAQDFAGPVRWIVVDDGSIAQPVKFQRPGWDVEVVRPVPVWSAGQNTQARNLLAGLAVIDADAHVVVVEDDDWYSPDWLSTVAEALEHGDIVGESHARYYNIGRRVGRQLSNATHSSLCSTAVRGDGLRTLREVCESAPKFIDIELWAKVRNRNLFDGHRVVGIKGLPGRDGIGMGHRDDFKGKYDPDGSLLREWVGPDAELYL